MAANHNFFAIYTNKQQLHIFSSTTTELIKRGIVIQGVCMITQCQSQNLIGVLTMKGGVQVYKVVNPEYPSIDSVQLLFETSISSILKFENTDVQVSSKTEEPTKISVNIFHLDSNGMVQI